MKDLFKKAFDAYAEMLLIHIDTKTMDTDFHEVTAKFYETLFTVAHQVGEKHVDLGGKFEKGDLKAKIKRANEIIADLLKAVEKEEGKKETTLGSKDMLGSLANDLENIQGTAKSFV